MSGSCFLFRVVDMRVSAGVIVPRHRVDTGVGTTREPVSELVSDGKHWYLPGKIPGQKPVTRFLRHYTLSPPVIMPLPKTLIYIRTDRENSTEQLAECIEYYRDKSGINIPDTATQPPFDQATYKTLRDTANLTWAGDDEDTYPKTLENRLREARDERYDRLVVPHLHTFSNSLRDVHKTIDSLHAAGVTVYVAARRVKLRPRGDARPLLADCADFERLGNARQLDPISAGERHKGGRPPLGYVVESGYRRPGPRYDDVEATLHDVVNGETSIHEAAARLDVSRTTIRNAVTKRPELYDLPADAELPSQ